MSVSNLLTSNSLTIYGGMGFITGGEITISPPATMLQPIYQYTMPSNCSSLATFTICSYFVSGPNAGFGGVQQSVSRLKNINGTTTITNATGGFFNADFPSTAGIGIFINITGSVVTFQITSSTTEVVDWAWTIDILSSNL
jgi:hypothetical protein